ncbi:B12-binding domain-containing radical SAM protein [Thermodesulfobacteriota bacterium]
MRILLVDPPGKNKGLNTGLGYLSAVLKENHEVYVLDLNNIEMGLCGEPNPEMPINALEEKIIKAVDKFEPDLFGVSVKTFTADIARHILKLIKDNRPKPLTIVGGPHITLDGFNFIKENRIDLGIQGEGEDTLPELCAALEKKEDLKTLYGIYYWDIETLVHKPRLNTIRDLDALPFPFYDNFSSIITNDGFLKEYPLLSSRGCPYGCSYCSMPVIMGKKWRSHSSDRVIRELKHAKKKYSSVSFTVVDDNFTLDLKRVERICDTLIAEKIDLPWNSQNGIRADRISAGLARKMKQAGCRFVWIGIESADEEVFNHICKGENLEDIKKGIKHLKTAGIKVGGFFIIGLPHSTRETDLKGIDFVKEQVIDGFWFNFVPYPHTQACLWVQTHGKALLSSDGALQFGTNSIDPVFETEAYSKESRINTYNEIHIKLRLYDRLADPCLKQWDRWQVVYKMIVPFGFGAIVSLIIFVLTYNAKLIARKFLR